MGILRVLSNSALVIGVAQALVTKDGKTGRLPAMGFNSWNAFKCDISEDVFLTAAEEIVSLGLKDAGYEYVNIDGMILSILAKGSLSDPRYLQTVGPI